VNEPHFDPRNIHVESDGIRPWEHHDNFNDVMAEQIRQAPWYMISIAIHGIIALILATVNTAGKEKKKDEVVAIQQPEKIEEIKEEEEEIVEPEPEVEPEPVLQDTEIVEEQTEDFTEMEDEKQVDSAFDSDAFNDVVGLGGGAGGKFGGRGGGRRRLGRKGGRQTAEAIRLGLEWLKNHQDSDGRWSCAEFMKNCPQGDICDGPGNPINDVGCTGLALLAFLGDGSTMRGGPYKDVVQKAVLWLKDQMDDEGLIGMDSGHSFMYNHAIASLGMVEAYGLSKYLTLKPYAQKCVNYISRARNPYKVWRYFPHDGENDTSVTGWMVFALNSAKEFHLKVDADALKYAEAWFEEVTDQNTGQAGYTKKGEPSSRKEGLAEKFPHEKTEAMTAVGLLCRIFLGQDPKNNPVLSAAAETMLKKKPNWNPADGSIDMYYWYYASYAMFQMGGRYWKNWRHALEGALLKPQRRDGHAKGSWDPISAWSDDGGRVYTTALGVLTLEVYYRYSRLIR